jgi:MHS family shikimate/dehydroshikimate transporter-like MFS transporter
MTADAHAGRRATPGKVAFASFIGTTIEWYDFFIYGTAAALVFGALFFPAFDPAIGTIAAFATFGVAFVARPVGALIAGHLGDRVGRKTILVGSLITMGVATLLIGVLPTYPTIGIWAPILLTLLRVAQGLGLGAEWSGAVLMATEHAPAGKRGLYGSWPQIGVPAGSLLATATFAIVAAATGPNFVTWGWRIPFLLSAILVVVGLIIRLRLIESPSFTLVKSKGDLAKLPIGEVLRLYPRNMLLAIGARFSDTLIFYIVAVFVLSYATVTLGVPRTVVLTGVIIGSALELAMMPLMAALSDRVGRRPVFLAGAGFAVLFAYPFFLLIDTGNTIAIWVAIVLMLLGGHAPTYATSAALLAEMFPTRVRMSGTSVSYNISAMLAAAPAPLVATALLTWAGGNSWPVAVYIGLGALLAFVSVYLATESFRSDLDAEVPTRRRSSAETAV